MSTNIVLCLPARVWAAVSIVLVALFGFGAVPRAEAQATANPPELMSYQGFLADGSGAPLGNTNTGPKNYDVIFRVYDMQTGGTKLWTEQQTVSLDKGYFSVLLGEGAVVISPDPEPRPLLSTLFSNNTASDRFVELTVKGIGNGNPPADVTIQPRLRLLAAPYAFLARSALKLVRGTGGDLVTSDINGLIVNGDISAAKFKATTSFSGNGSGITEINAANVTAGTLANARLDPNPVVTGTMTAATFTGSGAGLTSLSGKNINLNSIEVDKLVAAVKEALCPTGTILSYAGVVAPSGWFLCNGDTKTSKDNLALFGVIGTSFGNGGAADGSLFKLPDFRGRFLRGWDGTAGRDPDSSSRSAMNPGGAANNAVGSVQGDELRIHQHAIHAQGVTGSGPHVAGGISLSSMSVTLTNLTQNAGGKETRPVNAYVNYIIKY